MVQGTNLHHALMLAGRHIDRHPEHEPVVLIVTDGRANGSPAARRAVLVPLAAVPETVELTLAEADKLTRRTPR